MEGNFKMGKCCEASIIKAVWYWLMNRLTDQ